jgi:4-hydroxybenzoate polyprenyltransferase
MRRVLKFIRFSHTIFALPFAIGAMIVAARGLPSWQVVTLILLAMVFARTAAMAFNRVIDWEIDKENPRTAGRHQLVTKSTGWGIVIVSSLAFLLVCWGINSVCFVLSPVALAIVFFYSVTKRFTNYTQLFIGLALAVAPVGAWLAVRGEMALAPGILAVGVLFWVAGFDLIYAIQDHEFDKAKGMGSMIVKYGVAKGLQMAQIMHVILFVCLAFFGVAAGLGVIYYLSLILVAAALIYEHRAASRLDVEGINKAFFDSNAFVGVVFVIGVVAGLFHVL